MHKVSLLCNFRGKQIFCKDEFCFIYVLLFCDKTGLRNSLTSIYQQAGVWPALLAQAYNFNCLAV